MSRLFFIVSFWVSSSELNILHMLYNIYSWNLALFTVFLSAYFLEADPHAVTSFLLTCLQKSILYCRCSGSALHDISHWSWHLADNIWDVCRLNQEKGDGAWCPEPSDSQYLQVCVLSAFPLSTLVRIHISQFKRGLNSPACLFDRDSSDLMP